jgi:hypothetical protein
MICESRASGIEMEIVRKAPTLAVSGKTYAGPDAQPP